MKSSLEIAQEATLRPIMDIAREIGLEEDEVDLYGKYKAKISLSALDRLAGVPDAKVVCVSAITPTKAGEGKTTTSVSLTQGTRPHRQAAGAVPARAVAWPDLRHQGRRRRRRAHPGRADGRPEPALHRRLPRHRRREQHAGRVRRPAHVLRQRGEHRPAPGDVAAGGRHERPPPAQRDHRPRRRHPRHPARDRIRHRGRLRGDGDHGDGHLAAGPAHAGSAGSRSPTTRPARRSPPSRWAARAR